MSTLEQQSDEFQFNSENSILFSQQPSQKVSEETNIDTAESFLFNSFDPSENQQQEIEEDVEEDAPVEETDAMEIDYSPTYLPTKKVKLFSGKTIELIPKPTSKVQLDETQFQGSYINMDVLTNKVNLRNSIKENRKKLAETTPSRKYSNKKKTGQIWSEKYKPNSFVQLCSAGNDKQYRMVLHWLKKWSHCVFGEDVHDKNHVDTMGRPLRKILLIHGPAGVGKTVATHILASQMGYSVQELNAANSMDTLPQASGGGSAAYTNASSALKLKIINALTSNSIGAKGKPSCLVIDEIDSLANAGDVVKVLNDLVQSDQRALYKKLKKSAMDDNDAKKKSKKKDILLTRPIICIANDIYSHQSGKFGPNPMDKLRPLAEVVAFKKPMTSNTVSGTKIGGNAVKSVKDHLMTINNKENLDLDYQTIGEIVEICDADLRACINHLQFNGRKVETTESKTNSGVLIDKQLSWFSIVDSLFRRNPQSSKDENFSQIFDSFMNGEARNLTNNASTFDKVLRGVFNKYLDVVHHQDDSLVKPSEFSDWVGHYTEFSRVNETSEYFPLIGLKTWSLFSELNHQTTNQPLIPNAKNLDFECLETLKSNKTIIRMLTDNIPIETKLALGLNSEIAATEFLPFLSKIMTPSMSAKVKSDLSDIEKAWVEKLTALVKDFELSLENSKDLETGLTSLKINPNWDSITNYDTEFAPTSSASAIKQIQFRRQAIFPLVTAEMDRLNMVRKTAKRLLEEEEAKTNDHKVKRLKVGSSIDFFKNKYEEVNSQISDKIQKPTNEEQFKASRIWVKYNEGFSNAVRKNIGWNDFWLP
ncbi:CTF18 Chromosome transmission fidelity protein 18 [Candida maltosa Xu316]